MSKLPPQPRSQPIIISRSPCTYTPSRPPSPSLPLPSPSPPPPRPQSLQYCPTHSNPSVSHHAHILSPTNASSSLPSTPLHDLPQHLPPSSPTILSAPAPFSPPLTFPSFSLSLPLSLSLSLCVCVCMCLPLCYSAGKGKSK